MHYEGSKHLQMTDHGFPDLKISREPESPRRRKPGFAPRIWCTWTIRTKH